MKNITLKIIEQSENVSLYSICFENDKLSEFEKFIEKFKKDATINNDYKVILTALSKILEDGALERLFRPEGKMSDNVCALSVNSKKLRLYCLRISENILIIGNGGVKSTKSYQEDEELYGYVMDLQAFDNLLQNEINKNNIIIVKNELTNINGKTFTL